MIFIIRLQKLYGFFFVMKIITFGSILWVFFLVKRCRYLYIWPAVDIKEACVGKDMNWGRGYVMVKHLLYPEINNDFNFKIRINCGMK